MYQSFSIYDISENLFTVFPILLITYAVTNSNYMINEIVFTYLYKQKQKGNIIVGTNSLLETFILRFLLILLP